MHDTNASDLHVARRGVARAPEEEIGGDVLTHTREIIGDERRTALDEAKRRLTLAQARIALEENAKTADLAHRAVERRARRTQGLQDEGRMAREHTSHQRRRQDDTSRLLHGIDRIFRRNVPRRADKDLRLMRQQQLVTAHPLLRSQRLEVGELRVTQHLHSLPGEVLEETRQGQARTVDDRFFDRHADVPLSGDELKLQPLTAGFKEVGDREGHTVDRVAGGNAVHQLVLGGRRTLLADRTLAGLDAHPEKLALRTGGGTVDHTLRRHGELLRADGDLAETVRDDFCRIHVTLDVDVDDDLHLRDLGELRRELLHALLGVLLK